MANNNALYSTMVRSGRTTYFVDVKEAKNNNKYLAITTSQPSKEDPKKFTRRSINIFDNTASEFVGAVQEAMTYMR